LGKKNSLLVGESSKHHGGRFHRESTKQGIRRWRKKKKKRERETRTGRNKGGEEVLTIQGACRG